jgi:hypothetical protein
MFWVDREPCGAGFPGDSLDLLIGKDTIPLVFGFYEFTGEIITLARSYGCAVFSG